MTQFIYARVSTKEQSLKGQINELKSCYPEAVVIEEKASGKNMKRPELIKLLASLKADDSLIVYDMSRLNRNTKDFLELLEKFDQQGINLIIHNMGGQMVDSASATGKMILTVMAAVETMNREILLEKQAHGISVAKKQGKFKGKQVNPETIKKCKEALSYIENGMSKEKSAKAVGIGIATLYRYIRTNTNKMQ